VKRSLVCIVDLGVTNEHTFSLCNKVDVELVGPSPTGCVCNLPIKKKKRHRSGCDGYEV
jgi:hypothetical protein